MTVAILTCVCDHSYQDKRYGKKRRVFNARADRIANMWRCTACGKERSGSGVVEAKKGKK